MVMIIASLAFILAFAALWLASTSLKKMEGLGDVFVQRIQNSQRKELDEVKTRIKTLEARNDALILQMKKLTAIPDNTDPEDDGSG